MITNVYSFAGGTSGRATIGELVRAALYIGDHTLEEIQALLPAAHPENVRTVLLSLVAEGVAEVYQREVPDPESLPKPDGAPTITYRDLPPDLQAVWLAMMASSLESPAAAPQFEPDAITESGAWCGAPYFDRAEAVAMETVRRANGGELPAAPARDIVAEGAEIARAKLERDVIDAAGTLDQPRRMRAVEALRAFEEQHGRRP